MSKLKKCFMLSACDYVGYTYQNIKIHSMENNKIIFTRHNGRTKYQIPDKSRVMIFENWQERETIENNIYEVKYENGMRCVSTMLFSIDSDGLNKKINFLEKIKNENNVVFMNYEIDKHLKELLSKKEEVFFDDDFNYQLVDINNEILKNNSGEILNFEEFQALLALNEIKIIGRHESKSTRAELRGRPVLENFCGPMFDGGNIRYETWKTYEALSI